MDINVIHGDLTQLKVRALVAFLSEGDKEPKDLQKLDQALDGAITTLIEDGELKGKKGETTVIHTFGKIGPTRLMISGVGKPEKLDEQILREVTAGACRQFRRLGQESVAVMAYSSGMGEIDGAGWGQAVAEGATLGLYRFNNYKKDDDDNEDHEIKELSLVAQDTGSLDALKKGVQQGQLLAEAAILARNMVNEPANVLTPTQMADIAREVAEAEGLEVKVLEREDMEKLGMGAFLGVARGSSQPPKLIVLEWKGDPGDPSNNLGLIGKGITFDSGGISIKPAGGMEDMKGDMAGGASVIAAMKAIGRLKPKINVTGMIAATENMPGGSAQRPGDVVRSMMGKTIEVINTDAEGRLVLADALYYARQLGITRMVDIATLTGAVIVALGHACSGVMGNDQPLIDSLIKAGNSTGERIWQLPMYADYKEDIKSNVADIKNTGGRGAGPITAAKFLEEFTEDTSWAHLDIAGTYMASKQSGYLVKGGTGVPTRTLVNLALALAAEKE